MAAASNLSDEHTPPGPAAPCPGAGRRDQLAGKIQERHGVAKDEAEQPPAQWERRVNDDGLDTTAARALASTPATLMQAIHIAPGAPSGASP